MKLTYAMNPAGTESFRWASNPSPKGHGFSPQTQPKQFRHWQVPSKGRIFGQADLSKVEARAVAFDSQCKILMEIFSDPTRNLYIEVGNRMGEYLHWPIPIDKESIHYTLTKSTIHAGHYMEGPFKFAWQTGLSIKMAKTLQAAYLKDKPEIITWQEKIPEEVAQKACLKSIIFGIERTFFAASMYYTRYKTFTKEQRKEMVSWRPQTVPPEIINPAALRLRQALGGDFWIHLQTHDSILFSSPVEAFGEVAKLVEKECTQDVPVKGRIMHVPVEIQCGYNSGDLMDWKGETPCFAAWRDFVNRTLEKKSRSNKILEGVYGPHVPKEMYAS